MSTLAQTRHQAEKQARAAELEAQREAVRRRLKWAAPGGLSEPDLRKRLGWPTGVSSVLSQLEDSREAHVRDGVWFSGPGARTEEAVATMPVVDVRRLVLDAAEDRWTTRVELAARITGIPLATALRTIETLVTSGEIQAETRGKGRVRLARSSGPQGQAGVAAAACDNSSGGQHPRQTGQDPIAAAPPGDPATWTSTAGFDSRVSANPATAGEVGAAGGADSNSVQPDPSLAADLEASCDRVVSGTTQDSGATAERDLSAAMRGPEAGDVADGRDDRGNGEEGRDLTDALPSSPLGRSPLVDRVVEYVRTHPGATRGNLIAATGELEWRVREAVKIARDLKLIRLEGARATSRWHPVLPAPDRFPLAPDEPIVVPSVESTPTDPAELQSEVERPLDETTSQSCEEPTASSGAVLEFGAEELAGGSQTDRGEENEVSHGLTDTEADEHVGARVALEETPLGAGSDPIGALGELLDEAGVTFTFGLSDEQRAEVKRRLASGEDWETIALAVGWHGPTLREFYETAPIRPFDSDHPVVDLTVTTTPSAGGASNSPRLHADGVVLDADTELAEPSDSCDSPLPADGRASTVDEDPTEELSYPVRPAGISGDQPVWQQHATSNDGSCTTPGCALEAHHGGGCRSLRSALLDPSEQPSRPDPVPGNGAVAAVAEAVARVSDSLDTIRSRLDRLEAPGGIGDTAFALVDRVALLERDKSALLQCAAEQRREIADLHAQLAAANGELVEFDRMLGRFDVEAHPSRLFRIGLFLGRERR